MHFIDLYLVELELVLFVLEYETKLVAAQVKHLTQLGTLVNPKGTHVYTGIGHFDSYFVEMYQFKVLNRQIQRKNIPTHTIWTPPPQKLIQVYMPELRLPRYHQLSLLKYTNFIKNPHLPNKTVIHPYLFYYRSSVITPQVKHIDILVQFLCHLCA